MATHEIVTEEPDFAIALSDVSSSLYSRSRRLIFSIATLGMMRSAGNIDSAVTLLSDALEAAGFRVLQITQERCDVIALVRGTDTRLQREFYREQLDAWIQSRSSANNEFVPQEAPAEGFFTPARRIALLHQPLLEMLPGLSSRLRSDLLTVDSVYPIQNRRFCSQLLSHLARRPVLQAQLLHALRNEYGEKVAFLFAFRSFYQRWLRLPALLGVLLWLCRFISQTLPALLTPLFGLAVPVWASLMLEGWAAQQKELASLWGVDDLREAEVVRSDFRGNDPRTGGAFAAEYARMHHTRRNRLLKRCVTIPVLGGQLLLLTGVISVLYAVWISIHESDLPRPLKTLLVILVSVAWGLLVEFFNWHVFHRLASFLNRWENHRTEAEFETHLVRKLFAFLFVDGFLWYFLLAFLHIPFGDKLRTMFGLSDETFQQEFWMHALVIMQRRLEPTGKHACAT